jgi:hypothetical protein
MNRESGDIMMISYFNYEQFALQQGAVLESFATVWHTLMAKLVAIIFSVAMGETSIEDAVNQIDQVNQTDLLGCPRNHFRLRSGTSGREY